MKWQFQHIHIRHLIRFKAIFKPFHFVIWFNIDVHNSMPHLERTHIGLVNSQVWIEERTPIKDTCK